MSPARCRVKWPNDVLVGERKIAGVLIEARHDQWAVIGIGLNLTIEPDEFPPQLRETAASLGAGDPESALAALCSALSHWLEAPATDIIAEFDRRLGL